MYKRTVFSFAASDPLRFKKNLLDLLQKVEVD